MESISEILFVLTSGLLFPVIAVLLILFVYALVMCAVAFMDYSRFCAYRSSAGPVLSAMDSGNVNDKLLEIGNPELPGCAGCFRFLLDHTGNAPARERMIANMEVDIDKRLGRSRLMLKLGPMFGLMGTLIPMGPALTGLASGDVASMAYNMEMAFATTVIGILISAAGVVTLQVLKRCYARVMNDIEFVNELITVNSGKETA